MSVYFGQRNLWELHIHLGGLSAATKSGAFPLRAASDHRKQHEHDGTCRVRVPPSIIRQRLRFFWQSRLAEFGLFASTPNRGMLLCQVHRASHRSEVVSLLVVPCVTFS
jgi:hypothetical protein